MKNISLKKSFPMIIERMEKLEKENKILGALKEENEKLKKEIRSREKNNYQLICEKVDLMLELENMKNKNDKLEKECLEHINVICNFVKENEGRQPLLHFGEAEENLT